MRWLPAAVAGFAIVYGILTVVVLAAWLVADDPLGALPAFILGLPWSPITGYLTRLAPGSTAWLTAVLALPLLLNLVLLVALHRGLARA